MYDVSDETSFDNLREFWVKEAKQYAGPNVRMICIGNKSDLAPVTKWDEEERVKEFCDEYGMQWVRASARENVGVELLFMN